MVDTSVYLGIFLGSFSFVVVFGIIISIIARCKQRERLQNGTGFAQIKTVKMRFNGTFKRVSIMSRRPLPEEIFELQDYYDSKDCGSGWEREAIETTFKMLQELGYDVKLFRTKGSSKKNRERKEVDLSHRTIHPTKEVKKEIKRLQRSTDRQERAGLSEDKRPLEDEEAGEERKVNKDEFTYIGVEAPKVDAKSKLGTSSKVKPNTKKTTSDGSSSSDEFDSNGSSSSSYASESDEEEDEEESPKRPAPKKP